jgi:hypothetical protein
MENALELINEWAETPVFKSALATGNPMIDDMKRGLAHVFTQMMDKLDQMEEKSDQ